MTKGKFRKIKQHFFFVNTDIKFAYGIGLRCCHLPLNMLLAYFLSMKIPCAPFDRTTISQH